MYILMNCGKHLKSYYLRKKFLQRIKIISVLKVIYTWIVLNIVNTDNKYS